MRSGSRIQESRARLQAISKLRKAVLGWLFCTLLIWGATPWLMAQVTSHVTGPPEFLLWIRLNLLLLPVIGLLVLLGFAAWVYRSSIRMFLASLKPGALKRWEAKMTQRLLEDEDS